jgi:hypothetical protein
MAIARVFREARFSPSGRIERSAAQRVVNLFAIRSSMISRLSSGSPAVTRAAALSRVPAYLIANYNPY